MDGALELEGQVLIGSGLTPTADVLATFDVAGVELVDGPAIEATGQLRSTHAAGASSCGWGPQIRAPPPSASASARAP